MLTFGSRATALAAALPDELPIIAFDVTGIAAAYLAAVDHRVRDEPFFVWPCIPPMRALTARLLAEFCHGGLPFDEQRDRFGKLADGSLLVNGMRCDAIAIEAIAAQQAAIGDLLRLADGLFAPSWREADRIAAEYGVAVASVAVAAAPHPHVPIATHTGADATIVVWANGTPYAETLLLAHALAEMRLPVVVVAGNGETFGSDGASLGRDLGALLAGAGIIVDATIDEPFTALALARAGTPLVVAETSGAAEHLDGVLTYAPWSWKSAYDATSRALGTRPPRPRDAAALLADARATIARAAEPPPLDGPLVSVIVPTYNRRERLPHALRSLFAQRYRNLEVIVVNDGGEPVDDIVAAFPPAQLISYAANGGVEHAINTGFAAATGAYVTHVSDDDAFYPDHLARLVDACERTGCSVAHGNTLIRFEREGGRGVAGFAANVFCRSLEKTESFYNSPVAGHSFIIRRAFGERAGWFDETLPVLGDQELQTRLARHHDFAHVDRVTAEWRFSGGEANLSSRKQQLVPTAMQMWFDRNPSGRPAVEAFRAAVVAGIQARPPGTAFVPTVAFEPAAG